MIYGQFQYYIDELNGWNRAIVFHKEELQELVRQISVLLCQGIVSFSNEKVSNSFTDQLLVQEQQFDHITQQIFSQQQRLERVSSYFDKPIEYPVSQQQDSLRSKMKNIERIFIHTKYSCSFFLSLFLSDRFMALRVNNTNPVNTGQNL
jgi:hypothetical protein